MSYTNFWLGPWYAFSPVQETTVSVEVARSMRASQSRNPGASATESSQPVPLTRLACEVLRELKKEQKPAAIYVFPSPRDPNNPVRSVKRSWKTTLTNAEVPYFPIYNLRHVFCTRLSWVAPDAVVQRAMRHSSPETKRRYQLGIVHQVREHLERANEKAYEGHTALHFRDSDLRKNQSKLWRTLTE
jgi:integrase